MGRDGTPLPFNRSKIFPYAFRHTFCQRYADAGVPLHVLQALMDHRSADTTAAYFQASKKMKRDAVDTLRVLAMDRHGNPAPMASATAYELRSVAVPWGNCVEPSNVKAGGRARQQSPPCRRGGSVTVRRTPPMCSAKPGDRRQDSLTKRTRVLAVVDDMKANGDPLTFLAVARKARVSNWLVCAEGVREHIEAARRSQERTATRDGEAGGRVSDGSLAVDLELIRTELRRIRDERDRLKAKVQRGLGQQIDQAGNADLQRRIRELGDTLQQRDAALAQVRAEREALQVKLSDAENTVGALRRSLRQMMRDQST